MIPYRNPWLFTTLTGLFRSLHFKAPTARVRTPDPKRQAAAEAKRARRRARNLCWAGRAL